MPIERDYGVFRLLQELDKIVGVSGYEGAVGDRLELELRPHVDSCRLDALGNRYFIKHGIDPSFRVMLCAHMDEIGLIVSYVDEGGFVYTVPAGLLNSQILAARNFLIHTEIGVVPAVSGTLPVHLAHEESLESVPGEFYLDLGCENRAEVEALGVRIGDVVSFAGGGHLMNKRIYSGRAVDNRAGCAVVAEVMKRLRNERILPSVHAVGTVQEELGIRGAGPAAANVSPRVALVVDVVFAGGTPEMNERRMPIRLGFGPSVKFHDWSPGNAYMGNTVPRYMTDRLVSAAERESIPFQREVILNGGTDGWAIALSGAGILTGCVSIPCRYLHSNVAMVHREDLENTVQLILSFIRGLDREYGHIEDYQI